ncbi:MAG: hypothetical protein WBM84_11390 [Sedimenticolaceae bacterium]
MEISLHRFNADGGWDLLGPEREITRSQDNVLYSLDGRPALQVYKKYLGEPFRPAEFEL